MSDLHSLKIKQAANKLDGCRIELDGFLLIGVCEYTVKTSALEGTELTLKLAVKDLELFVD